MRGNKRFQFAIDIFVHFRFLRLIVNLYTCVGIYLSFDFQSQPFSNYESGIILAIITLEIQKLLALKFADSAHF